MTESTRQLVLEGLSRLCGDDYERASYAFAGLTAQEMQQQHGQSGETRQQILDGYAERRKAVDAAIAEIKVA